MIRRKYRTQEPPFNISIELVKGCNLACPFCAMSAIQETPGRGYKFMDPATLELVSKQVAQLGWNSRIDFAMRGEPTMHPDYIRMVAIVREHLPRQHITFLTNGAGLLRKPGAVENITALFNAGVNTLGLDDYETVKFVPKIMEKINEQGKLKNNVRHKLGFIFYKYPDDLRGNPHQRHHHDNKMLVRIRDISATHKSDKRGNHNRLFNLGGLAFPLNDSMAGKACAHPFRLFVVHWDGNVPLCCNTWDGQYNPGDVHKQSLEEIWQSNAFGAAREMLIRGRREFAPCLGCDYRSYRNGLLPDGKGQVKLHQPDKQTHDDIAAAQLTGPREKVVRLPWEMKHEQT